MFGAFRLLLALLVAIGHLGGVAVLGAHAVHAFFVLSGYLMTLVMQQSYGFTRNGVMAFAANRLLRLYPSYFLILALTTLLVLWVGHTAASDVNSAIALPRSAGEFFSNLTMIYPGFYPNEYPVRLSPPTWALTNELIFYALIALGVSRSCRISMVWFFCSAGYFVFSFASGMEHSSRYYTVFAASLPFSLGAVMYHFKSARGLLRVRYWSGPWRLFLINVFFLALFVLVGAAHGYFRRLDTYVFMAEGFYLLNYVLCGFWVFFLSAQAAPPKLRDIDKRCGDLSYPLYLVHWQCALLIYYLFDLPAEGARALFFLAFSLALSLVVSWLVARCVDAPVERIRELVRPASI